MASDWIKWAKGLPNKPKVIRLSQLLGKSRAETVLALMVFWEWCDTEIREECIHPDNTIIISLTDSDKQNKMFIDELVGIAGFAVSLAAIGWLILRDGILVLPNFARHNGAGSKVRSANTNAARQRRFRAKQKNTNQG